MDGERVERAMRATQRSRKAARREETLLLTDSRIIHVAVEGRSVETFIASVDDVESVHVGAVSEGYGAFIWAGLAVALSGALYGLLEQETLRIVAPLLTLAMAAYLLASRLIFSGGQVAAFRIGAAEIAWRFDGDEQTEEVGEFIRDLYSIKTARARGHKQPWERW